jgi:hypothetical integral membrane protein (TIGR02206 family)
MGQYFTADYHGAPFQLFGPAHFGALGALLILNLFLLRFKSASEHIKRTARWILLGVMWGAEIAWHLWNVSNGLWTIQTVLPLHLCSVLIWLTGVLLITKNQYLYEFAYFLGIGGAIQYLATPDLGIYGFPHFRFFQTFTTHGLLLTCPIYMTVVEGMRPTWTSLFRVAVGINLYMIPVYFVNSAIGSNYLMINAKPATPSLLDLLPEWPYYIIHMELIGLVTCLLLYLPFIVRDRRGLA